MRIARPVEVRFWEKVNKQGSDDCWLWTAFIDKNGYGLFRLNSNKQVRAHRISYEIAFGEFAQTLLVCHRCDNPSCVNPKHLFLGTVTDNNRDKIKKKRDSRGVTHGRFTKPECTARGERHGRSKLNEQQVAEIRQYIPNGGLSRSQLARHYGVAKSTIDRILSNRYWSQTTPQL